MKTIKISGVVISENSLGDSDKILTILTPNIGKITVVAKGAKRPKSLLMAGSQFLCFGEYILYKSQDMYKMNSCEPIEVFYNVRIDLEKLNYASHITKIINDVTTENQNNYNILKLFLNTLYTISETDKELDFILSIFKFRLLKILGYSPNILECTSCGKKDEKEYKYFSIKDDGFKCSNCGRLDTSSIEITEGAKYGIIYSILADSKKIYSFKISDQAKREIELIARLYFNEKLEKEYKIEKLF